MNAVDGCICIPEVVGSVESGFETISLHGLSGSALFEIVFSRTLAVGLSFGRRRLHLVTHVSGIHGALY